jgi:hypothetical protein
MRTCVRLVFACSFAVFLATAASAKPPAILIRGVPHTLQKPDFCGEACVEMYLRKLGHDITQDDVFHLTGLNPALGRGAYTRDLVRALGRLGFDVGPVWSSVPARAASLRPLFAAMLADLAKGIPSIVCMRTSQGAGAGVGASEHFRLVLGYDRERDELIYHEPAAEDGAYRRMPRARFLSLWPLRYGEDTWTVIRMRLNAEGVAAAIAGGAVPARGAPGHSDADYAQHVMALRSRLGQGAFRIVVEKPFVVVSDASPEEAREWAQSTVRWAARRLKALYFARDPGRILDVFLFRDGASYRQNARRLFGETPDTPYGYYLTSQHALVMNIATGGGTLVHEIVHPYMEANFPGVPAWFNEGLGSLYEQSTERKGRIWGLTNWRLRGLQSVIRRGALPSFRTLLGGGDRAFYADRRGDNYAQARYLCMYLQERGLLTRFYHAFFAGRGEDPTGYRTLMAVLGLTTEKEMRVFERRWSAWVLSLRFPQGTG